MNGSATRLRAALLGALLCGGIQSVGIGAANAQTAAKTLFDAADTPAPGASESIGSYAKGCMSGAVELPADGPNYQAMRLSRDRHWGHPVLRSFIEDFAAKVHDRGVWPGVLIGDMSMPRGGPMPSGHSSHQIGLDTDVWLRPMPKERLSEAEREDFPFRTVLKAGSLTVDDTVWNDSYREVVKLAATDSRVQRVLVHPGIKKKLCETTSGDRTWLNKIRPYYGHDSHMHVRLFCQPGSPDCEPQRSTGKGDGCDDLDWWFDVALQPPPPNAKPYKPKPDLTLADLPQRCAAVLRAGPDGVKAVAALAPETGAVPHPTPRPSR
ncbi:penicillin-insensitive murein endopeptidase [Fulvimarina endophytica]|uniref:Penicillin-insensitive murein endopeptidase n=1 Tax=Fulvimarina endophytica TaxID=2293836 RepID=A0A371X162_9HYPH|nr:penicillin-insensitive murein endopeptidase [Fulvimarina endophytica]RFC62972.1 penicillin-insensitive murein endopeptidase [Fulvimarina endophytica]